MKRLFAAILAVVAFLPLAAGAQATDEQIVSFDVQATLEADRGFFVTETIVYDFGQTPRHGIYRDIPERYSRNGGTYRLRLNVKGVTMDGASVPSSVRRSGDDLRIKIGDPDETIQGVHTYVITYHTGQAINFFEGEGELYWNITGNGWEVPIGATAFTLTGPDGFDASAAQKACYTGVFGSTVQNCTITPNGNQLTVRSKEGFSSGEGLTVAVRFPKGMIAEPTAADWIGEFIRDNGVLALPFITFAFMFWLWHHKGRDPKGRGTVVPHYDAPRGMTPAEMAALKEQDVPMRLVTATILDLARRGYLKVDFGEEKGLLRTTPTYTFIKVKEADSRLSRAENEVFNGLFETGDRVDLADLKGKFYKHVTPFKHAVFEMLKTKGLFEASPAMVRAKYTGAAVAVVVAVFWIVGSFVTALTSGAIIASAIIVAAFGWFMPRATKEGAVVLEEVEGFKWFLSVTEKDRLAFHNAPEIKPAMFHVFLPAAIAFGVEEKWADQFKGLEVPPPDYATGSVLHHWAAWSFVNNISQMNSAAAASAYAAPSSAGSGGSGFSGGGSGGGFGGGGGGSW